jgi:GT2 family glycosyltransferase
MIQDSKKRTTGTPDNTAGKIIIAIIIPVFNGLDYTRRCLEILSRHIDLVEDPLSGFEIIVVDDGNDGTSGWVGKHYPRVHILKGDGNLWWSGGINRGVGYALENLNADYLLWWNNDIEPAEDYLEQVADLVRENDENILIGSKIFIKNSELLWGMGGKFDPVNGLRHMYGEGQKDCSDFRKPFAVDWFPGMGTIIHRRVFEKIGMLDEKNFPQYHGDSDFTYRAKKAGFRLVAFPQLVIYNDIANTGLKHQGKFTVLYKSLFSIKSNSNLRKDIAFYRKHSSSPRAYLNLVNKYFRYIGGFFKWKTLNLFGVQKQGHLPPAGQLKHDG